ncbi:hypothetical protein, conserved [Angomonas deanei]|uniref:LRRK2 ARM repeat domain-containing protein n=1 Tax=Angomonas deanei TaxID=59799 RepID=A0A7G2CGQ4_9TRYP|nr:hypothetical protein, conserved [Angomonas deanei]
MEDFFHAVVSGQPAQEFAHLKEASPTAQYTILCAQVPSPEERIETLMGRLKTSDERSAAQNVSFILLSCVNVRLEPDAVEELVENIIIYTLENSEWPDLVRWVCAMIHYYATDEFTVSIFSEFDATKVAVGALHRFPQNTDVVLAACAALSHFNLHDIDDGITQLTQVLSKYSGKVDLIRVASRALAEFTSYSKDAPKRFVISNEEFVKAGGIQAVEKVLRDHLEDEEIITYVSRIVANATSSGVTSSVMGDDSRVIMHLTDALGRFQHSELLCSHILRVFSNVPGSRFIDWDYVSSLFNHTKSELIALECIHFLTSVAVSCKEMKPTIYKTGCVNRLLDVMRAYPLNAAIQEGACGLLSYLSFDSEAITTTITDNGGILLVLDAMRNFPENEDLLVAACASLSGLTFNNMKGQQEVVNSEGVALILAAMRRGKKARLQENGCLALGTMCWNTDLKGDVVRLGGVDVVMKALENYYTSSGLVKNACRALAQIAFNCEAYRKEMSVRGVIPLIIRGMEQHPNYDRAQMHGCVALSYLSWTNEGNAEEITTNRGYKAVVAAMRNHLNSHEVQEHACRALANITNVGLEDSAAAIEQIVLAMRRHERIQEVQEEACRAMVTLSLVSPANKDRLWELKGAEAVAAAMAHFPDVPLVQQEASNALAHLAYEHPKLNKTVTEVHGVSLLLKAMRRHKSNPKIQLNACGGLSALAFDNPVAQRQIFELGGVKCVIDAMSCSERLRMLELGCSVLGTLAWNTDIKEKVAVDAIPEILAAMRDHEDSPLLQKSTCRAISQFAFNSENNRQLLSDAGAIPLIVHSMRTHLSSEKLVTHALKALTYLCWESNQVAEKIIEENIEEVLQQTVQQYSNVPRVYNEAIHLSKILFRKTSGSPQSQLTSPPMASPQPIYHTPGPCPEGNEMRDYLAFLSPPVRERDEADFYAAPADQPPEPRGPPRGGHRGRGNRGHPRGRGAHIDPEAMERRFPRRGQPRGPPHRPQEGLWDDPEPGTFFGNRSAGEMNWQQTENAGHVRGRGRGRGWAPRGEYRGRGRGNSFYQGNS